MRLDSASYFAFLGVFALLYAAAAPRLRPGLLLLASLIFYATSSLPYLVLFGVVCGLNYAAIQALGRPRPEKSRSAVLFSAVALNVAVLLLFKYAIGRLDHALGRLGNAPADGWPALAAPLGISYFSLQMIACVTDAHRRTWIPEAGPGRFFLFGFFFPQISSGPIPRAERLVPQLGGGPVSAEDWLIGWRLIAFGLFKKFVVANRLNDYVGSIFAPSVSFSSLPTFIGLVFNALQLYADFSGYVDIAIGSARLLGIRLDPNFDRPFVSKSITEFWRRWHMTLSFWLRDYIFMPLLVRLRDGGRAGIIFCLLVTFALCGLWHAAKWTFLLFGVLQGVAMSGELLTKKWRGKFLKTRSPGVVAAAASIYTLGFFALTQVLFKSSDLVQAGRIYADLFSLRLPQSLVEILVYRGPVYFALDFLVLGLWPVLAYYLHQEVERKTPQYLFACAVCILLLGRLGTAHFIYAAF